MKKDINYLYKYAKEQNIKIQDYSFGGDKKWKGHCIYNNFNQCMIFLNDNMTNNIQKKCTLAHEIGHFKKGIIQNNILSSKYRDTLIRSINDFRANKWAINELIPFETFKKFLGTNKSKSDIANELEVTEELVELACHVYEPILYENKII